MNFYSIILDIAVLFIGFSIIRKSYRNGFLRSAVLFVGSLAAILISIWLSRWLANVVYENFLRESIIAQINEVVQNGTNSLSISELISQLTSAFPAFLINPLLAAFGGQEQLAAEIQQNINSTTDSLGTVIADTVVGPITISLIQMISCLLILAICVIIIKILASMFKRIYAIPIIGTVNAFLGAGIGILQAAVILYILALICSIVVSVTANELSWLNTGIIDLTYLFKYFYNFQIL